MLIIANRPTPFYLVYILRATTKHVYNALHDIVHCLFVLSIRDFMTRMNLWAYEAKAYIHRTSVKFATLDRSRLWSSDSISALSLTSLHASGSTDIQLMKMQKHLNIDDIKPPWNICNYLIRDKYERDTVPPVSEPRQRQDTVCWVDEFLMLLLGVGVARAKIYKAKANLILDKYQNDDKVYHQH